MWGGVFWKIYYPENCYNSNIILYLCRRNSIFLTENTHFSVCSESICLHCRSTNFLTMIDKSELCVPTCVPCRR